MEKALAAFKIWANPASKWTPWTKPVLFTSANPNRNDKQNFTPNTVSWQKIVDKETMIIVDLQGAQSVYEGVGLAQIGYRPIALYNGVNEPKQPSTMIVDVTELGNALIDSANYLAKINLPKDAPPAFLLDANRMTVSGTRNFFTGKFDNRWSVFPQDMPSATFLKEQGIKKIIIRSDRIAQDLAHVLYRYQNENLKIVRVTKRDIHRKATISKPKKFANAFYRFQVILGLSPDSTGGFGAVVPTETQGYGHG